MKTYSRTLPLRRRYLLDLVRTRYGIVLNEPLYLKERVLSFFRLGDAARKEVWRFDDWDAVYDIVYLVPQEKKPDWRDGMRILHAAGEH